MTILTVAAVALGAVIIGATSHDVFHTLWHPSGQGRLSRWVGGSLWRGARRWGHRGRVLTGPVTLVVVIATWAVGLIIGWALVYVAFLPDGFVFSPGLDPERRNPVVEALYFSMVALSTLGLGDVVPGAPGLRLLTAVEALTGFALLSASVSWVLQLAPALTRRRALAVHLGHLRAVHPPERVPTLVELEGLARDLAYVRVELRQYDEMYYFREQDAAAVLAGMLVFAGQLAEAASSGDEPERVAGAVLARALDDLAELLESRFLPGGGARDEVFRRYAADQGVDDAAASAIAPASD